MQIDRFEQQRLASIHPGDHLGFIYTDEAQRWETLIPFIRDGLEQGQKVVYIYDKDIPQALLDGLRREGAACDDALARGQLALLPFSQVFLRPGGRFDPQSALGWLAEQSAQAQDEGYAALRYSAEMAQAACDGLTEFETRLNVLPEARQAVLLCQYGRADFDPADLLEALQAHPRLALDGAVYDNLYYLPPGAALRGDPAAARLDRWLDNLARRVEPGSQLDQARSDLSRRVGDQLTRMERENQRLYQGIRHRLGIEYALIQANEALRETESRYKTIFDAAADAIFIQALDGHFLEVNQVACERFGYTREEIVGMSPECIVAPEQREQTMAWLDFLRTQDAPQTIETVHVTRNGRRFPAEVTTRRIRYQNDGAFLSVVRDITERKRAELELEQYRQRLQSMVQQRTADLRESEARYRLLVNHSPAGIMVVQDGRYVFVNPSAEQSLGYAPGEMTGMDFLSSVAEDTRELAREQLPQAGELAPRAPTVLQFVRKEGGTIHSEAIFTPIVYGGSPAALIIGQDVTERLRYEQALEASLAEKEVMLREIHHRVKNNLNVITALIDLQKATVADPRVLQMFKELQTRAYTMALVHETLYRSPNLAKIDFSSFLYTLVDHLYDAYGPVAGSRLAPVTMQVDADRLALKVETAIPCGLIVSELVTNALKYAFPPEAVHAGQDCQVRVRLRRTSPGHLALEVSDNGVGLPAGLDWRSVATLGLQLIQVLARQLGGEVSLSPGCGVTWQITFPERR